jgi:hypothetical protein
LFRAVRQSFCEFIFGVAASRCQKSAQVSPESILMLRGICARIIGRIAEYGYRKGVVQHFRIVQDLMSSAAKCNTHRRAAGGLRLHSLKP